MRFLPTRVHGGIGYTWGIALLTPPWLFGFEDVPADKWIAVMFGVGAILYSAFTACELRVFRILPLSLHLAPDGVAPF